MNKEALSSESGRYLENIQWVSGSQCSGYAVWVRDISGIHFPPFSSLLSVFLFLTLALLKASTYFCER